MQIKLPQRLQQHPRSRARLWRPEAGHQFHRLRIPHATANDKRDRGKDETAAFAVIATIDACERSRRSGNIVSWRWWSAFWASPESQLRGRKVSRTTWRSLQF